MGDGRGDSQRVWHEFAGSIFDDVSILDAGAGYGWSKPRLAHGGRNRVTTHDVERSQMERVDVICDVRDFASQGWDIVTAIDVVEHVPDARRFLVELRRIARRGVFFTTPARLIHTAPWHFTPIEIEALAAIAGTPSRYFARYHSGEVDEVREVDLDAFRRDPLVYAHGVYSLAGEPAP